MKITGHDIQKFSWVYAILMILVLVFFIMESKIKYLFTSIGLLNVIVGIIPIIFAIVLNKNLRLANFFIPKKHNVIFILYMFLVYYVGYSYDKGISWILVIGYSVFLVLYVLSWLIEKRFKGNN